MSSDDRDLWRVRADLEATMRHDRAASGLGELIDLPDDHKTVGGVGKIPLIVFGLLALAVAVSIIVTALMSVQAVNSDTGVGATTPRRQNPSTTTSAEQPQPAGNHPG